MGKFTTLTAIAAAYDPVNVDTDQIIPARYLKEKRGKGYGQFLFRDLRYRDDGGEIAGFVLNREPYRRAQIFVANANFGCGSSREGAVYAFADAGFRAVIAPSFGDIFFNNCLKNGIVPARLSEQACSALRAEIAAKPGTELTVDLERQVVIGPDGASRAFEIDEFWRDALLKGLDELGLTRELLPQIETFERAYRQEAPWAG